MGGGTKDQEQCRQLCFEFYLDVEICPWIYSICKAPGCNGIMKLAISQTLKNPKKRFIACQYSTCGSFKWLEDAIKESKSEEGTSFTGGCYGCGVCGHWWKDCPWRDAMKAKEKRTSEKKLGADVKINVTMNLNDFCSEFKGKAKLL
ncbi:hypothetical protein GIB67_002036 [Kingdonia uniflora]|uniref:CCHC-type domain-containing protein n=1 Tax=Kingdonia uniflora TaxID=39325 RepID=A0A7J7KW76_9MAGN|nr:hypothetical protein GIB67_002036 [Kingdonia uniflora]